jgi:hypothetical protein
MTLPKMCETAQTIVVGRCRSVESRLEGGSVSTYTTFSVEDIVKGSPSLIGRSITIRLPGGTAGGLTVSIAGIPRFHPDGEAVLLLTEEDHRGYPSIVGLSQGCFPVGRERGTVKRVVVVPPDLLRSAAKPAAQLLPRRIALEQFLTLIRSLLPPTSDDPR